MILWPVLPEMSVKPFWCVPVYVKSYIVVPYAMRVWCIGLLFRTEYRRSIHTIASDIEHLQGALIEPLRIEAPTSRKKMSDLSDSFLKIGQIFIELRLSVNCRQGRCGFHPEGVWGRESDRFSQLTMIFQLHGITHEHFPPWITGQCPH
jgi:hypothetical protein